MTQMSARERVLATIVGVVGFILLNFFVVDYFLKNQTRLQTELARNTATRFTFHPAYDFKPVWSPDGARIVFASNREGQLNLYLKASSGAFGHAPIVHLGATRHIDKDPPRHASLREPEQPRREEEKGGPARGRGGVCGAGKFQPRDR